MPCILIAPDKFKNTLSASEVARETATAINEFLPGATLRVCPMADGGEGTAEILASHLGLKAASIQGHNAMMRPAAIHYFESDNQCAVDCAAIVGLQMLSGLKRLTPWKATTYPLGEFINEMLAKGKQTIIVGLGGSATIDGGIGMLQALGARFLDVDGEPIGAPICADSLSRIFSVDFSEIPVADISRRVRVLADVDLPLLPYGPKDTGLSSLSFAPQKGVAPTDIEALAEALANYVDAVDDALYPPSNQPRFQGAAGGLGYAFHRILHCHTSLGAERIISTFKLFDPAPHLVITGEGSFDLQSLTGKAVGSLCSHATSLDIPVIVIAGQSDLPKQPDNVTILTTQRTTATSPKNNQTTPTPKRTPTHEDALADLRAALRSKLPEALANTLGIELTHRASPTENPDKSSTKNNPISESSKAIASHFSTLKTDLFKKTVKKIREKL